MKLRTLNANSREIAFPSGVTLLISYETCVAAFIPGQGFLRTEVKHSKTTSKHINSWIAKNYPNIIQAYRPQSFFDFLLANPSTVEN